MKGSIATSRVGHGTSMGSGGIGTIPIRVVSSTACGRGRGRGIMTIGIQGIIAKCSIWVVIVIVIVIGGGGSGSGGGGGGGWEWRSTCSNSSTLISC